MELQRVSDLSGHSSPERKSRREWILGRVATLLCHYWRDDDPSELNEALGRDWADILEGMPQDVINRACVEYLRLDARRKPTPGAIYALARAFMPPVAVVAARSTPRPPPAPKMTAETANAIMEQAGFRPKRIIPNE